MFYDDGNESVTLIKNHIAWNTDKNDLFINPPGNPLEVGKFEFAYLAKVPVRQ